MHAIIAGGRDYELTEQDCAFLDRLRLGFVITGGATGADECADRWAHQRGIETIVFKADWDKHGKAAGPIRNGEMVQYLQACLPPRIVILFPGGRGTADMQRQAENAGLTTVVVRQW